MAVSFLTVTLRFDLSAFYPEKRENVFIIRLRQLEVCHPLRKEMMAKIGRTCNVLHSQG